MVLVADRFDAGPLEIFVEVELRSRVGSNDFALPATRSDAKAAPVESVHRDAVAALIALGYKPVDADQAIRRAALASSGSAFVSPARFR